VSQPEAIEMWPQLLVSYDFDCNIDYFE